MIPLEQPAETATTLPQPMEEDDDDDDEEDEEVREIIRQSARYFFMRALEMSCSLRLLISHYL